MIPFWGFAWGEGSVTTLPETGAVWAWNHRGREVRTFTPRVRDEFWVESGHQEKSDPYLDTRDAP